MPKGDNSNLTELQRLVLNSIQDSFPVESRPYEALARKINQEHGLSLSEEDLIGELKTLKERGFIRRLGAILNSRPLGYKSILCAAKVPAEKIDYFAGLINSYPQVTHNYVRNSPLNVWFTFCYLEKSELNGLLTRLREELGENEVLELNSAKIFKIRAVFKLSESGSRGPAA
jgi:DNA-binding Lrp family transcriptional regulator